LDKVYFAKVKSNAITPSKIEENAGYDFYACYEGEEFIIKPFKPILIPTGIAWASSDKYDLNLKNERGSVGTKGLIALCGLIDSGFRNEIFFCVVNINDKPFVISKNVSEFTKGEDFDLYPASKAIAQGRIEIVPKVEIVEIEYEELLKMESSRGLGMLGDSGK
jgi:dUTP pyrophosphatase